MSDDLRELRGLLREALSRTRMTGRRLEKELGIGHGNLQHLLEGQLELKVRHLLAIARVLKVPPHQLLELGCPDAEQKASRDLYELLGRRRHPPAAAAAEGGAAAPAEKPGKEP